jgi:hypothetical protein
MKRRSGSAKASIGLWLSDNWEDRAGEISPPPFAGLAALEDQTAEPTLAAKK